MLGYRNLFSYQRVFSYQNLFSYQSVFSLRMCSLARRPQDPRRSKGPFNITKMCSLINNCVLLPKNVFSYQTSSRPSALKRTCPHSTTIGRAKKWKRASPGTARIWAHRPALKTPGKSSWFLHRLTKRFRHIHTLVCTYIQNYIYLPMYRRWCVT